jgi:hypothetical protein
MKAANHPRKLMLCSAHSKLTEGVPYVMLKGRWLKLYGFTPGDQVIITNPSPNSLLMTVYKTSEQMNEIRKGRYTLN